MMKQRISEGRYAIFKQEEAIIGDYRRNEFGEKMRNTQVCVC
ncbi:hypothetical protein HanPSC8_Chr01g0027531 [Helianthus annuus]|nr:hypothetical protein HanPSC8_Chr01g0027531 [Helianthus annuus]